MTTQRINDQYSVTLGMLPKPAKGYAVEARIFNHRTGKATNISVRGEGQTISVAQDRALAQARQKCPFPEDDE